MRPRPKVFGIELDSIGQTALIGEVLNRVKKMDKAGYVLTINLYHVVKFRSETSLRSAIADAAFVVPDGRPLLWMARLHGITLQLVTGSDLVIPLCQAAAREQRSVFLFGATFETLTECGRKLTSSVEGIQIAGVYSPPFGFERDANECAAAESAIRTAAPDIVFVALSVPKQEIWTQQHAKKLGIQAICVGAALDFLAGTQRRAPLVLRRIGFEWLWRALTEPSRLGIRYARILCWLPFLVGSDLVAMVRRWAR